MSGTASIPGWYVEFQANILRQLPRPGNGSGEIDSMTVEGWNKNQDVMKSSLAQALLSPKLDERFFFRHSFSLTVPSGYNHDIQLAKFKKEILDKFLFCPDEITDANFARATNRLIPSKTYVVNIFGIRKDKTVSSSDCLSFLRANKAILVGAQGISLAWQLKREKFPRDKNMVSFDKKNALWWDSDNRQRVPEIYHQRDGNNWYFNLGFLCGSFWDEDDCLLCLCDPDDFLAGQTGGI